MTTKNILSDFQSYADSVVKDYNLPAVSIAVWHNNTLHEAAAGILNIETGVEATTDSIFQIGSISKVMTACLIMQLVDEGKIELDKPVKMYLQDFSIADAEATEMITVRQLLNHTSGISGDFFPDDARQGGNLIARFVDRCYQLPLAHPVGEYCSYSNAAYAIAGRLIEVVTGTTWCDAMEQRIFQPLGMTRAICRPEDVLRYRAAIGHMETQDPVTTWQQARKLYLPAGLAAAGTVASMTAKDLILFGRAHLEQGNSADNQSWMTSSAIAQMQRAETPKPVMSSAISTYIGLGWGISKVSGTGQQYLSHTGGTLGQRSVLRIVPESNLCFSILVNCDRDDIIHTLSKALLEELADIISAKNQKTLWH